MPPADERPADSSGEESSLADSSSSDGGAEADGDPSDTGILRVAQDALRAMMGPWSPPTSDSPDDAG